MIKIKEHIKIGCVYKLTGDWTFDSYAGSLQDGTIITLLDFGTVDATSSKLKVLYNNKIYIRNYVFTESLNNLELVV